MRRMKSPVFLVAFMLATILPQALAADGQRPPHLDARGLEGWREYLAEPDHRAFAIAPGGTWGYVSGMFSRDVAEREALAACRRFTEQTCVLYSVDGRTVFDAAKWPTLWRPCPTAEQAAKAAEGTKRGMRFPDLAFTDRNGRRMKLSDFRGRVVFLHFWASWCGHCQRELPRIRELMKRLEGDGRIAFVLLQAREPFSRSLVWLRRKGLDMAHVYDSGSRGFSDTAFRKADGGTLEDRRIAPRFPATYVLDRHGIVLFSLVGPSERWDEYLPFLKDVASCSDGAPGLPSPSSGGVRPRP